MKHGKLTEIDANLGQSYTTVSVGMGTVKPKGINVILLEPWCTKWTGKWRDSQSRICGCSWDGTEI